MAGIKFDMTGDNRNVLDAFNGVQQGVRQTQNIVERSGQSIENMFTRIKDSALGGFKQMAAGLTGLAALVESGNFIKTLYDDMAKFSKAMKEVSTLSQDVTEHMGEYKQKVVEMTTQIAIAPEEAAKALYQIESAGHHGADGLNVLEQSAKGAIGGVTETAIAADAITTILNSYKLQASEAAHINDLLFTTVRLGKTTYGELGSMIAQVTPIAAAYGVAIEDVLAAIASLTKSGTKTSIAIRQVRDAITATTNSLGDGAFKTRSFLDAMDEVAEKTKGSESALKQDLSKLSAMNAVLALTGKNSASARQDLEEMKSSTGAATEAYEKMADIASNATTRLRNNIFAFFMPLGDEIRGMSQNIAEYLNEAFDTGSIDKWIVAFEGFVAAYALYRGLLAGTNIADSFRSTASIAATNAAYDAEIVKLQEIIPLKEAEAKSDLDIAVAEGRLTPEKAELIATTRAEAQAHLQNLQAMAAEAQAAYNESTTIAANAALRLEEAEAAVAAAEMKYAAAVSSGNAVAIETAETELNTAVSTKNIAAKELQTAREAVKVASVKASAAATTAQTAATVVDTAAQNANATSTGILAGAKLKLASALEKVKAATIGNPLFMMAATVIGVTYAVYKLVTAENAHEAAIRASNEELEKQKGLLDERQQGINDFISTIRNENATELDRIRAYNKLKDLAPEITNAYTRQQLALADMVDVQQKVNEQLDNDEWKQLQKNVEDTTTKIDEYKQKLEEARKEYEKYKNKSGYEVGDDGYSKKKSAQSDISSYQAKIESLEAMLENYKKALDDFNEAAQQAADEARPIEIRIKEAQDNVDAKEAIKKFYDEAIDLVEELQAGNDQINYATGKSNLEEFIETAQQELDDLRQKTMDDPMDVRLQMEYQEKQKILNYVIEMKNQMASSGLTTIPLFFKMDYQSFLNAWNAANQKLQQLVGQTVQGGATTYQQDFSAAQKAYQDAQKRVAEISKNKSKYTKEDWTAAQSQLKNTKDNYAALGGDVSNHKRTGSGKTKTTKTGTGKNDAVNRAKQEARYKELQQKQKLEQERAAIDLQFSTTQAEIDAMAEGNAKTIAQITLDFNQRKEEIKRGYEDLKQEKIDQARQLWEADPKNKDKVFNPATVNVDYTEEEKKNLRLQNEAAEAEYNRQLAAQATADEQAMVDYLKTYGSFQEQKLAIAKEYAQKIAEVEASGDSEGTKAWKISSLRKQQEEENQGVEVAAIQAKIDWYSVFDNVGLVMKSQLEPMLESLKKYSESPKFQNLAADQQKAIVDAMVNIRQMIGTTGDIGWRDLASDITAYQSALRELSAAEAEYRRIQEEMTADFIAANDKLEKAVKAADPKAIQEAQAEIDALNLKLHEAGQNVTNATNKVKSSGTKLASTTKDVTQPVSEIFTFLQTTGISSLTELWGAFDSLRGSIEGLKALKDVGKGITDAAKDAADATSETGEKISDAAGEAADALGKGLSKAGLIASIISAVLKILDILKDGIGTLVSNLIDTILNAVQGILEDILSGDFLKKIGSSLIKGIGGIIDTVIGRIGNVLSFGALSHNGPSSWFTNSNAADVAKTTEELTKVNEDLADRIDDLKDVIGDSAGNNALNAYETALKAQQEVNENQMEILKAQMGYHSSHHSNNYYSDDATIRSYNADAQRAFQAAGVTASTITGLSSIYNLTPEQLKAIKDFAPDLWQYLTTVGKYDKSEYWDAVVEQAGKTAELTETIQRNLTQTSWSNLRDGFLDTLIDMESDSKDFAKSFEDMMFKALINSFVLDDEFDKWLNGFYEKWAEKIKSGSMTKTDWDSFNSEYTGMRDEKISERDQWAKAMGYTGKSAYEQDASSGGWQTMSQDTADELNGRFTAIQIAGEGIKVNTDLIVANLNTMSLLAQGSNAAVLDIRDMIITSNSYLEDVVKYAKLTYNEFGIKIDTINQHQEEIYNAIRRT